MSFKFKVGDIITPSLSTQDEKLSDVILLVLNIDDVKSKYTIMILNTYAQYQYCVGRVNQFPAGMMDRQNMLYLEMI
jgi:5-hydroxyisourate hydrolase-like protein (transthyretin family)